MRHISHANYFTKNSKPFSSFCDLQTSKNKYTVSIQDGVSNKSIMFNCFLTNKGWPRSLELYLDVASYLDIS